ncbi:MAG: LPP20 family lipoprotein [Natronospirillum sp.]|uniref:LPP20 family lipoprotein n=1 Tax=Natronospirillum sp. TaxID=2812955 RepID=UPI0025D4439C|nr:LPP20 family lipoprotein [Natronospirillum sp.]MCH8552585.1 LPP20 family lipoprotein [Natronospirillum sp.]
MKRMILLIGLVPLLVSGCALFGGGDDEEERIAAIEEEVRYLNQNLPPMEPMVLRSTGYGTVSEQPNHLSESQQRLLAMRASKLDAYRTLAERVYGTAIVGNTTVENLVIQNDRFRSYVDTYIYGARVVSQDPMADGSWETTVEMVLDEGFRNCLVNEQDWRRNSRCRSEMVHDLDSFERNSMNRQGLNQRESGLYFLQ